MQNKFKYDVFISYASEDIRHIEPIVSTLESHGYTVWWDRKLRTGEMLGPIIVEAIAQSRKVIVAWSANSVESKWVIGEAQEADDQEKLLPISLDDSKPQLNFRSIRTEPFANWNRNPDDSAFKRVIEALGPRKDVLSEPVPRKRSNEKDKKVSSDRCPHCGSRMAYDAKTCSNCAVPIPDFSPDPAPDFSPGPDAQWRVHILDELRNRLNNQQGVICLVSAKKPGGADFWAYICVPKKRYTAYLKAQHVGNYNLADYGTIIVHGQGKSPPSSVKTRMRQEFFVGNRPIFLLIYEWIRNRVWDLSEYFKS